MVGIHTEGSGTRTSFAEETQGVVVSFARFQRLWFATKI